jgi:hypothetical protein
VRNSARSAAARLLERNVEAFERAGYRLAEGVRTSGARMEKADGVPVHVGMVGHGRVFGGNYALEVSTAEPVLPETRGAAARGRGLVRLQRIAFRGRRGDDAGAALAARLNADERLQRALVEVHFEAIRVEPDGRAAIRHMGGSVVWVLFPPLVRPVPLVDEQARATLAALDAFAQAGTG